MVWNKRTSYYSTAKAGRNDSKFEAGVAETLRLRQLAGDIKSFKEQVTLSLDVNGYHVCNYKIDFVIQHNDGEVEYLEAKGFPTETWKLKWKLFEALYDKPGNILTVEFQGKSWKPQRRRVK